jgi:DNA-directed RNA polymerase specialized sigma24 family protein
VTEVTRILSAIEAGDRHAAERLLPLVYDELRKLAARKLARESPGQTLEATALVHEAYVRLVAGEQGAARAGVGRPPAFLCRRRRGDAPHPHRPRP